jgi:hypothetical protein
MHKHASRHTEEANWLSIFMGNEPRQMQAARYQKRLEQCHASTDGQYSSCASNEEPPPATSRYTPLPLSTWMNRIAQKSKSQKQLIEAMTKYIRRTK